MTTNRVGDALFAAADYLAAGITGAATAAAIRAVVRPDADMVVAMLIGMVVGMAVHIVLAVLFTPLLGGFQAMVPGSLIGMYGGMLFAMRDVMQHPPVALGRSLWIGALFGVVVMAGVRVYDRVLRTAPQLSGTV